MAARRKIETDFDTTEPPELAPAPKTRRRVAADNEQLFVPLMTTGPTVTVACKLPHGLDLILYRMEKFNEPVMGGGVREGVKAIPRPETRQRLNGFASDVTKRPTAMIYGGYAMTYGVSKEVFDQWRIDNADSDIVQKNLIFAISGDHEDAHAEAVDNRPTISGFEPIDPRKAMTVNGVKIEARTDA